MLKESNEIKIKTKTKIKQSRKIFGRAEYMEGKKKKELTPGNKKKDR